MFSALSQGSLIHILDKTDGIKYKTGEVIGVTQPNSYGSGYGASSFLNPGNITIKAKVDGEVKEYPEVPATQNIISYNGGTVIISETQAALQSEIENTRQIAKQHISNVPIYEKTIKDCEDVLKIISPQFAKDKERDDRIDGLDTKVTSMESKLDKILNVLSNNNTNK